MIDKIEEKGGGGEIFIQFHCRDSMSSFFLSSGRKEVSYRYRGIFLSKFLFAKGEEACKKLRRFVWYSQNIKTQLPW